MRRTLALLALALALAWKPSAAPAQPPRAAPPTTIALRPAAEPTPALKYRLVPERIALVPGNAAIFYHRAIQIVIEHRARIAREDQEKSDSGARPESADERIARWVAGPIAQIPRDDAKQLVESFRRALNEVELGAMRVTCDWEFDRRPEGIDLWISEIQETRSLVRLVALESRLAILDGRTDAAMHWIQTGLVMGRHISQGPILVQALVGVATSSVMARCLEDLIQAPGTPSLYWALADRPRPFIDLRPAMEGERHLIEKEFPELRDLDGGPWGLDQARRFADTLQGKPFEYNAGMDIPGINIAVPGDLPELARRLGVAAMAARIYPEAKRALLGRGRPAEQVEAMPVLQVAALYTFQEYQRLRDDRYKWLNLPYWQSYGRVDRSSMDSAEEWLANPLLTLFLWLDSPINSARLAALRLDRQLDALQCIEAVRLHAAAHGGQLPASLDAITDAPVPIDPLTGNPFGYSVDGDSATLSAPLPPGGPDHPYYTIRYVLKRAR